MTFSDPYRTIIIEPATVSEPEERPVAPREAPAPEPEPAKAVAAR